MYLLNFKRIFLENKIFFFFFKLKLRPRVTLLILNIKNWERDYLNENFIYIRLIFFTQYLQSEIFRKGMYANISYIQRENSNPKFTSALAEKKNSLNTVQFIGFHNKICSKFEIIGELVSF